MITYGKQKAGAQQALRDAAQQEQQKKQVASPDEEVQILLRVRTTEKIRLTCKDWESPPTIALQNIDSLPTPVSSIDTKGDSP
jgi:hypothetical protein